MRKTYLIGPRERGVEGWPENVSEKELLHQLIDQIPDEEVHSVRRYVEFIRNINDDPVSRLIDNAPPDDEPVSAENVKALDEAYADMKAGRMIPHEEVRRRWLGGA